MIRVTSEGPLRATSVLWRPAPSRWALSVVCRATYDLVPLESRLAEDQEPPAEEDDYWDDDPRRSLRCPTDLVPFKARADVLLVGSAFAPRREPVRSLLAWIGIGAIDKSIEVFSSRLWTL